MSIHMRVCTWRFCLELASCVWCDLHLRTLALSLVFLMKALSLQCYFAQFERLTHVYKYICTHIADAARFYLGRTLRKRVLHWLWLAFALLCLALVPIALLCFALLCFTLCCFALLYNAILCFALLALRCCAFALLCSDVLCPALRGIALHCFTLRCFVLFSCVFFDMLCFALPCFAL